MKIEIRIALFTPMKIAGNRLQRGGVPMPILQFDFPDTEEGRKEAELARQQLQDYVNKYHVPKYTMKEK